MVSNFGHGKWGQKIEHGKYGTTKNGTRTNLGPTKIGHGKTVHGHDLAQYQVKDQVQGLVQDLEPDIVLIKIMEFDLKWVHVVNEDHGIGSEMGTGF